MAHSGKDILLDQLAACQDDESWYVPLSVALADLNVTQATWKQPGSTNSIWQIVNHLTFWNKRWLHRFQGTSVPTDRVDNDATFNPEESITEETWRTAIENLNSVLSDWRRALSDCNDSKMDSLVPNYEGDAPWWGLISNLSTHNAYHIGQIVYIRKLQGTWEPRT
jgi:uncharacterized damage-inducible protein DinB